MRQGSFWLGVLFSFLLTNIAVSSNVTVSPTHIHLAPHDQIESIQIANIATTPVNFQASVKAWEQKDGRDIYTSTTDFILSPPIFTIAPGRTQLLRVGLETPADAPPTTQKTYRLYLTEILPNTKDAPKQKIRLKLSLALFIDPLKRNKHIKIIKEKQFVRIINDGNVTVTIAGVDINGLKKNAFLQITPGAVTTLPLALSPTDKVIFYDKDMPLNPSSPT